MRMPPLLADFIYNRVCKLKCEKFLTRPRPAVGNDYLDAALSTNSFLGYEVLEDTVSLDGEIASSEQTPHE